jgi:chromosomal replication initiator protein
MDQSAETAWAQCREIIQENINRQSFNTWFEPLKAQSLTEEDGLRKLTIQLPSRFYYEWLEEHYFSLLRKTITKVLGPNGRLFYDVVIEQENPDEPEHGASMQLPARRGDDVSPDASPPTPDPAAADSGQGRQASGSNGSSPPSSPNATATPVPVPRAPSNRP